MKQTKVNPMTKGNKTFEKLLNSIENFLPEIQNSFDEYQKAFFPYRPPEFFCLELNGEAGELANNEKKLWKGKMVEKEHLSDEAADVFIALVNYANSRQIDLKSALLKKLEKIEKTRLRLAEKKENY